MLIIPLLIELLDICYYQSKEYLVGLTRMFETEYVRDCLENECILLHSIEYFSFLGKKLNVFKYLLKTLFYFTCMVLNKKFQIVRPLIKYCLNYFHSPYYYFFLVYLSRFEYCKYFHMSYLHFV